MRLNLRGIAVLLLLSFGLFMQPSAFCAQSDESQVKALFVMNFAKLTEWPADSHPDVHTFTIAIVGKMPPATFINVLKGQTVHGESVTVRHVDNVRQAKDSQLLYISDSERQHMSEIIKESGQYALLTVSDMAGFCEAGGMIGMVPVQKRLSFEVNLAAVRKARLSVSSQLLKLARVIYGQ